MTYFSLRKPKPTDEEELDEAEEESSGEAQDDKEATGPTSWGGALWCGISGPSIWLAAHTNIEAAIIFHLFMLWAIAVGGGWTAASIVLAWLAVVLLFIPKEYLENWAGAVERLGNGRRGSPEGDDAEAQEGAASHSPEDVYAATLEWVWRQIGDTQGVHLRDLLKHAQEHGMFEDLDVTAFRGHLERWNIPVRKRVRVRRKGITVGIHRDDLKPLLATPSPTPSQDPPNSELHPA